MVQDTSKFYTYQVHPTALPSNSDMPIVIPLVMPTADKKSLDSTWRLAVFGRYALKIPFNIKKLFGDDLMEGYDCFLERKPQDFIFHSNCWFSEWYSFEDEVCQSKIKFVPKSASPRALSDSDVQAQARHIFKDPVNKGSFRLEVTLAGSEDFMLIRVRFLPEYAKKLNEHSTLRYGDVASMSVADFKCHKFDVRKMDPQSLDKLPFGPLMFHEDDMTDQEYVQCVMNGFPSMLFNMLAHKDLETVTKARTYVANPPAKSGNGLRFLWATKSKVPVSTKIQHQRSTGTCQLSKFGTSADIFSFVKDFPKNARKYTCLSRAKRTWDSYLTTWRSLIHFMEINHIPKKVPLNEANAIAYVIYLKDNRCLTFDSIKKYISGVRFLHRFNNVPDTVFDKPRVKLTLDGIEKCDLVESVDPDLASRSLQRSVLTWTALKVLGHYLYLSNAYDQFNKQVIWTAALICFFGCFRTGEILAQNTKTLDPITGFTWNKIRVQSKKHYLIVNVLPKVAEDPRGHVVDLFAFTPDKRFCPITNINILYRMSKNCKRRDPVFKFNIGTLFTQSKMNDVLNYYLNSRFPEAKFSGHSFRAGLASMIAAHPEYFSENDAFLVGRWRSDAVLRYQRTKGVANKKAFGRVLNYLKKH